jgi:hypothetical protein
MSGPRRIIDPTEPRWYWLAFSDPRREPGHRDLGVAIIKARNVEAALHELYRLKIDPTGQGFGVPDGVDVAAVEGRLGLYIPEDKANRLLTPEEARKFAAELDGRN